METAKCIGKALARSDHDNELKWRSIRQKLGNFAPRSALDFGCGVERTLIPIAQKNVEQATGVDVAADMKNFATKHVAQTGANARVLESIPEGVTFQSASEGMRMFNSGQSLGSQKESLRNLVNGVAVLLGRVFFEKAFSHICC
jgi:SAM-dependent methyltransferase